jgi:hypothetical protein
VITDSQQVAVGANATVQNALSGRPAEFMGEPGVARLLLTADAPGILASWQINKGARSELPLPSGNVAVASAAGVGPKEDEDIVVDQYPLPQGSRLVLAFTNTTGAAINVRYRLKIA